MHFQLFFILDLLGASPNMNSPQGYEWLGTAFYLWLGVYFC